MSDEPVITCDPRRQFGSPCISGTRITATTVAGCVWAGDSVDFTAEGYSVSRTEVLWCCAWWVREGYLGGRYGKRKQLWHLWAEHAMRVLGGWDNAALCDPDDFTPEETP